MKCTHVPKNIFKKLLFYFFIFSNLIRLTLIRVNLAMFFNFSFRQGIDDLRSLIFQAILNMPPSPSITNNTFTEYSKDIKNLYYEIALRKKNHNLFMTFYELKTSLEKYGVKDEKIVKSMLNYLDELVRT